MRTTHHSKGFTLVEITVGIILAGLVLLAFAGMATVMQRSSGTTKQYADAQQNARSALDYITEHLRAAGSDIAAYEGQATIVHAGPYQVAFNADLDGGKVVDGDQPMTAIDASQSPNTVPASGTAIYAPTKTYSSGAETIVLTLDSGEDGLVAGSDQGDDAEEDSRNAHLYLLKRYLYGKVGGASNSVRESNVALIRGPVALENGDNPEPLLEYYYNHDSDLTTADKLWGDSNADGKLDSGEIGALTSVPDSLLYTVRMVKVNVIAEGTALEKAGKDNEGFVSVTMSSRVWIRNVDIRESSLVLGTVYYDANGDGKRDSGESGIPKVRVRLSTGRKTITDAFGNYSIPTSGGTFNVVETDPTGYTSTTPNTVNVTLAPGEKMKVDFGDDNTYAFGYIVGTVWDDTDEDMVRDGDEVGIPGVVVQLSNDMSVKTSSVGYYRFTVPVGDYTVTESDLEGYASTTPNSVDATVPSGDSVVVDFGDVRGEAYGTIAGHVYLDNDEDGVRDFGEPGLKDVSISLSNGDAMTTDTDGYYEFQLAAGKYDVYELDLDGYTSTTPNLVEDVWISIDSTRVIDFGDILAKDLEFIEILVSDTDRPLSLTVSDLREDTKGDEDIVLGTPTSAGPANLFVYINKYVDGSTPASALFDATPTYTRNAGTDVNALASIDVTADKAPDVISGQESYTGNNVLVWYNRSGDLGNSPDVSLTSGSLSATTRLRLADLTADGVRELLVGHRLLAPFTGGFETLERSGPGSYSSMQTVTTYADGQVLDVVSAIAAGDLDNDGDVDLVIGSNEGDYWGHIDIYRNDGAGQFTWHSRYLGKAGVNDVAVVELNNDGAARPDILVGVSEAQNAGGVQVWFNRLSGFGTADTTGYSYDSYTQPKVPSKVFDAGGEVLALSATRLDGDIFPEVVMGTRSSLFYTGDLLIAQRMESDITVTNVKVNIAGEVVTIDFADFNKDAETDIAVTTRTSPTSGKLAIYFLDNAAVVP